MKFEAIEAGRCRLRAFRESDLPAFVKYRSDPEVARYQGWNCPYSREEARALLDKIEATPFGTKDSWCQIAVAGLRTDELLGDLAVHFLDSDQIEIGFTVAVENQRKGYAKEALAALLKRCFQDLKMHRAIAITDARNAAAAGLLAKVGFRKEAHFRRNIFFKGEWGDEFLFACLSEEWARRGGERGALSD
jgi:RimJ/RimL family protein N-acetyltransferase